MKKIFLFFFMLVCTMNVYAQGTYTLQEDTEHRYFEVKRSDMSSNMQQYDDAFLELKFTNHPRVDKAEFVGTTFIVYFLRTESEGYVENFFYDYF